MSSFRTWDPHFQRKGRHGITSVEGQMVSVVLHIRFTFDCVLTFLLKCEFQQLIGPIASDAYVSIATSSIIVDSFLFRTN